MNRSSNKTKTQEKFIQALQAFQSKGISLPKKYHGTYKTDNILLKIHGVSREGETEQLAITISVPLKETGIPEQYYDNALKKIVLSDLLLRLIQIELQNKPTPVLFKFDCKPRQIIISRSALQINDESLQLRFRVLRGNKNEVDENIEILNSFIITELLEYIYPVINYNPYLDRKYNKHLNIVEDAEYLRKLLRELGLVSFIGEDSLLPRMGQFDDRPDGWHNVVPVQVPDSLKISVYLPHSGYLDGIGIKEGINLVIGGGYHGKSTFIEAIQQGVYNHIPGDGREFVVTIPEAVRVNSERGRYINCVNISPFVGELPFLSDNQHFSTMNASGSTSQAASIIESLEMGARFLILDEDTSATNLLIRDRKMQEIIAKYKEPLTPIIDKIKFLII